MALSWKYIVYKEKKMNKAFLKQVLLINSLLLIANFAYSLPKGLDTVKTLDTEKYLGKWYEIARLDFFFERGLNNTTAEYSLNNNGTIKVINRGYNLEKDKWKEAKGKAKFRTDIENGALKVSFFGPFYSEYNIISVDDDYKYALVIGKNTEYMWILSREKTIPENIKNKYLSIANENGINTDELIWVNHK